jgi:hypothetical protein
MKKSMLGIVFSFISSMTLLGQQNYNVTVWDGNRLRPGATQKEIREWITSHAIEAAFEAAVKQPDVQTASAFSPEQLQLIKMSAVRGKVLDELISRHSQLKGEADALYVHYDGLAEQAISQNSSSRPSDQIQVIKLLAIRATVCDQVLSKHPELKAEADSLYVQYDSQLTQEMVKATPR